MSTLAILLLSISATTLVSGFGFYSGFNTNNYNEWGSREGDSGEDDSSQDISAQGLSVQGDIGEGDSGQGLSAQGLSAQGLSVQGEIGEGDSGQGLSVQGDIGADNWKPTQQPCIDVTPIKPALLGWFFTPANGTVVTVPYCDDNYKYLLAEAFLNRQVHWRDLSGMDLIVQYDLEFLNYYLVTLMGYDNKKLVINCTLQQVNGSEGSCIPVRGSSTHGTNLAVINPSAAAVVYQNSTLGIVAAIGCIGGMEAGTAYWAIYSRYGFKIDQATLNHIRKTVTGHGIFWD